MPISRFSAYAKTGKLLVGGRPPIPSDRTINCAAARPADASGSMNSSTLPMLFFFLYFAPVGAKQMINVCLDGQQFFHLVAGLAIVGVSRFFL